MRGRGDWTRPEDRRTLLSESRRPLPPTGTRLRLRVVPVQAVPGDVRSSRSGTSGTTRASRTVLNSRIRLKPLDADFFRPWRPRRLRAARARKRRNSSRSVKPSFCMKRKTLVRSIHAAGGCQIQLPAAMSVLSDLPGCRTDHVEAVRRSAYTLDRPCGRSRCSTVGIDLEIVEQRIVDVKSHHLADHDAAAERLRADVHHLQRAGTPWRRATRRRAAASPGRSGPASAPISRTRPLPADTRREHTFICVARNPRTRCSPRTRLSLRYCAACPCARRRCRGSWARSRSPADWR